MRFNPLEHRAIFLPAERLSLDAAWVGHIPFAFLLMELTRPRTLVELGTRTGVSYCAFCQGIKTLQLPTRCFAVDTWRGDQHAGEVTEAEFNDLRSHHDPRYGSFSTLVRSKFDEALPRFADGSIDLLHIDGEHTYDAVRHDFDTWRPKLSDAGVVLFHDICERQGNFGVWRLWAELAAQYPSVGFAHSSGLGVLAMGASAPQPLLDFIDEARRYPGEIAAIFASLGDVHGLRVMAYLAFQELLALNRWRRAVGLPIDLRFESPQFISEHSRELASYTYLCVQEMVARTLRPPAAQAASPTQQA